MARAGPRVTVRVKAFVSKPILRCFLADLSLQQPKYIHAEARSTGPWAAVRHAVAKAYTKMPDSIPTMLVINDDLMVSLLDWGPSVTDIGLYAPRSTGHTTGYLAEDGPFADARCERLGAIGVFNVRLLTTGIEYRLRLFENPHALASVRVPPSFANGYPRYNGASPPASTGEKPWFDAVLKDREWLEDPAGKARREAGRPGGREDHRRTQSTAI